MGAGISLAAAASTLEDNPQSRDAAMIAEKLKARYRFNAFNTGSTVLTQLPKPPSLSGSDTVLTKTNNAVPMPAGIPALYGAKQ